MREENIIYLASSFASILVLTYLFVVGLAVLR